MPETYTQEQINALKKKYAYLTRAVDKDGTKRRALAAGNWKGEGGPDLSEEEIDVAILLSALSTAEKNNADWQEYNAELLHRAEKAESECDALKAQVAELEAIPDRLRKLDMSLCPEPHGEWSLLDGEKEIAFFGDSIESVIKQAEAAIVGKKEG